MDSRKSPTPNPVTFFNNTENKHRKKDVLGKRVVQEQPIGGAADRAAANAAEAAYLALPLITKSGIDILTGPASGFIDFRPVGLPIAIGGIVIDTIKAPFALAVATEEGVRAGIGKLLSLIFDKSASEATINQIFRSFLIRMRETATVLIALGLEDKNILDQTLKSGDIEELVGLTLLHTAYASRYCNSGLFLANDKLLTRDNCPQEGLALFDKVMELKESIESAFDLAGLSHRTALLQPKEKRLLEESRIVCDWLKLIKVGKQIAAEDKPGATVGQVSIVNKIISQIDELKQIGMATLPKDADYVASHMPRFGK